MSNDCPKKVNLGRGQAVNRPLVYSQYYYNSLTTLETHLRDMETFDRFRNQSLSIFPVRFLPLDPVWRRCLQSLPFYVKRDSECMNQVVSEYMGAIVDNWCVLGATNVSEDSE
jgi:hypothetical protein